MSGNGNKLYAVILAGGIGSRFWPLSRESTPKQILTVTGEESLLVATIKRLSPLVPPGRVSIVTNKKQAGIIRLHLARGSGALSTNYIVEPFGRNTAPAIGLAAIELLKKDPEALMAVLPADHMIRPAAAFRKALKAAAAEARKGHLVTFGIKPASPETGYGYIKAAPGRAGKTDGQSVRRVARFVEKPDLKRARQYLKDGGYFWNSGIFVWKARRILEEIKTHLPGIYKNLVKIGEGGNIKKAYGAMESVSIDHGVLEKAGEKDVVVIEAAFEWSDVGSWNSLPDVLKADKDGNIIQGRAVDIGSKDSIILGCDRVVATVGLENMVVVDTPDATLVCPRDKAQEVKDVVGILRKKNFVEHETHVTVERPWGSYTVLEAGEGYKVKRITVLPARRLSLQAHRRRSEHWVVISGRARVRSGGQRGGKVVEIKTNESTYIPKGVTHRLENPSKKVPLEIIEVQNGKYLEEDDIVRFDDDYERG
ncbi:MAG: mannose-1-phosphate guanylyltransferase/mannose-6-phosphate isomerase [Thermodesulfobacteriota bacterium]